MIKIKINKKINETKLVSQKRYEELLAMAKKLGMGNEKIHSLIDSTVSELDRG